MPAYNYEEDKARMSVLEGLLGIAHQPYDLVLVIEQLDEYFVLRKRWEDKYPRKDNK